MHTDLYNIVWMTYVVDLLLCSVANFGDNTSLCILIRDYTYGNIRVVHFQLIFENTYHMHVAAICLHCRFLSKGSLSMLMSMLMIRSMIYDHVHADDASTRRGVWLYALL